jgi:hypothetical protein
VYDLKASSQIHEIAVFRGPVTALAFTHDHRQLACYSLADRSICIYQFGTTLLGYAAAPRVVATFPVQYPEPLQLTAEEQLSHLLLMWTDRKSLRLVSTGLFDFGFAL